MEGCKTMDDGWMADGGSENKYYVSHCLQRTSEQRKEGRNNGSCSWRTRRCFDLRGQHCTALHCTPAGNGECETGGALLQRTSYPLPKPFGLHMYDM